MVISTLLATLALAQQGVQLSCPSTGEDVGKAAAVVLYNGARFETCCAGCTQPFLKQPAKRLKSDALKDKTVGVFLFDPVSGTPVDTKKAAAGPVVHNGIAFYFKTEGNKALFEADPKKYGTLPEKEALHCPVMGHEVTSYTESGGYVDHAGVRYYVCCGGCLDPMRTDPAKYAKSAAKAVKAPAATVLKD